MADKETPRVRVRSKGQVGATLERFATAYRVGHPDRGVRWVYDPQYKPELSHVMSREADGFRLVKHEELSLELEGIDPSSTVRVADLVLMSIGLSEGKALQKRYDDLARDNLKSVQRKYYDDVEDMARGMKKDEHSRNPAAPIGSATIAAKDFVYDVEQRSGDE